MKHSINVGGYKGTLKELAKSEGKMRYDYLAESYGHKADDLMEQAEADRNRGNVELASQLELVAQDLYRARDRMKNIIWEKICKKHMKYY